MVAANLSKTGGLRLLACYTRPRLLVSTTCYPNNNISLVKMNCNWNSKTLTTTTTNNNRLLKNGSLSLSSPNCKKTPKTPSTRLFCTSPNEDSSSAAAAPTTLSVPSTTSNGGDEESVQQIKDVANTLEIKVGKIIRAWRHEEADSLYVEEVDVGEAEPRIICSGLVKYIPLENLQEKKVLVLANLKARNMRGVKSYGMLMAASDESHEKVELLVPPEGSLPGERVWFGPEDEVTRLPDAASPNQIQKKKIWESVQPHLKTDESCVAALGGVHVMRTSAGFVVSPSLKNANIS